MQRRQDAGSKRVFELLAPVARPQRRVPNIANTGLDHRTRAWKQWHLMGRAVVEILVVPKNLLRAVAVVNIEIDNRDPLGAMFGAHIVRGYRDVVEKAKAHRPVAFGMMPRRAHLAEGVGGFFGDDVIDSFKSGTDRAQPRLPATFRYYRISVDMMGVFAGSGTGLFDRLVKVTGMNAADRLLDIVAQRCLDAHEVLVDVVRQYLVDGAHAIRALGMTRPGVVIDEARMGNEESCHLFQHCHCALKAKPVRKPGRS